jgi:uncharacterized protein
VRLVTGRRRSEDSALRSRIRGTEIDPRFEGRGLGSQLIAEALDDARRRQLAVLPFCPFVRSFIASHADYVGLVPEERRAAFGLADGG